MDYRSILAGLLVGILVGMTGMGGGSLMTPLLIWLFHYKAKVAVGADLAYSAVMKMFGSWPHYKAGTVDTKLAWQLAIGSIPGSLLGVAWSKWLEHHYGDGAEAILKSMIGFALLLTAIVLIIRSIPSVERWLRTRRPVSAEPRAIHLAWTISIGAVFGFLVGVTSVGSGALFGIAFLLVFGLGVRRMVGTDIFHAFLLTTAAAIGKAVAGDVDYHLVGNLLIGAIPGILIGSKLAVKLPEKFLRPTLATVLVISGFKLIHP